MILAAGRGERMRPLTDTLPKPLLAVHGKPLIHWHLEALRLVGITSVHVNTGWLGNVLTRELNRLQVEVQDALPKIDFSHECADFGRALETAGGIVRSLPRLAPVFWLVAGDVFAPGFQFDPAAYDRFAQSSLLAHLWLVPNPAHHPRGDFGLRDGLAVESGVEPRYTYSTIALLKRELFSAPHCDIPYGNPAGVAAPLAPVLRSAMQQGRVGASLYAGSWTDVGTPERLAQLNDTPLDHLL